jgi:hypothetical protein
MPSPAPLLYFTTVKKPFPGWRRRCLPYWDILREKVIGLRPWVPGSDRRNEEIPENGRKSFQRNCGKYGFLCPEENRKTGLIKQ